MGSTILNDLQVYKYEFKNAAGYDEASFLLMTETASTNCSPRTFEWYVHDFNRDYRVMETAAEIAAETYSGMVHYKHSGWNRKNCLTVFRRLYEAVENAQPIAADEKLRNVHLDHYWIFFDDRDKEFAAIQENIWNRLVERLPDVFSFRRFYGQNAVYLADPTTETLHAAIVLQRELKMHYRYENEADRLWQELSTHLKCDLPSSMESRISGAEAHHV